MARSGGSTTAPQPDYRVGFGIGSLLVGGAVALDFIGFLLMLTGVGEIVTEIIGFIGSLGFWIIFFFLGANFFGKGTGTKVGIAVVGSIIEMIPFINGLSPTFTIETVSLIYVMRAEDKKKAEDKAKASAGKENERLSYQQAYQYARNQKVLQQEAANDNEAELKEAA
jgi:hypothetical protein